MQRFSLHEVVIMAHHVIALFDSNETAQRVREALLDAGLATAAVRVYSAATHSDFGKPADVMSAVPAVKPLGTTAFLRDLFGFDDLLREGEYAEAMRRGTVAVVVEAAWGGVSTIEHVMRRFELVDLGAETERWRAAGWSSSAPNAPRPSEEELVGERVCDVTTLEGDEHRPLPVLEVDRAIRVFAQREWRSGVCPADRTS